MGDGEGEEKRVATTETHEIDATSFRFASFGSL